MATKRKRYRWLTALAAGTVLVGGAACSDDEGDSGADSSSTSETG